MAVITAASPLDGLFDIVARTGDLLGFNNDKPLARVVEPYPAHANHKPMAPFLVAYRPEGKLDFESKAFAERGEAERYYKWCEEIGHSSALYDQGLARLNHGGEHPVYAFDRFVTDLPEQHWMPMEFDHSAPYFRAFVANGAEPEGDFFFDLDAAIDDFANPWEDVHQILYDVSGVRLAVEANLDEPQLVRMDEFATWALSPYQQINEMARIPFDDIQLVPGLEISDTIMPQAPVFIAEEEAAMAIAAIDAE
jgi:hypothetical protein